MTPFGEHAVRFAIPSGTSRRRLFDTLSSLAGVVDVVLSETVGCVVFAEDADRSLVERELARPSVVLEREQGAHHVIEVVYDGEDLDAVARAIGTSIDDVVRLHTGRDYHVAMMGFLPGFAYLRGLPDELCIPRRAPRPRVPAGSVAIAGGYGGIYPFASPGGWHLLGRAASFEPFASDHALLALGDTVRFVATASGSERKGSELLREPPREAQVEVVRAAGLALLVDGGRRGRMHEGVPPGGPLVRSSFRRANALAGNDPSACAIEVVGTLEVIATAAEVVVADDEQRVVLAKGERHVVSTAGRSRVRYLAVAGGVDAPLRLGGRGSLLVAGIGRPLKRGDRLASMDLRSPSSLPPPLEGEVVPVILGPDRVDGVSAETLASAKLRISAASDRTGTRLEGASFVVEAGALSRPSAPMVVGAIELTPSGLIVLGPDHPTTGGYPVVGVVCDRGLDVLFAKPIGATVRLEPVAGGG